MARFKKSTPAPAPSGNSAHITHHLQLTGKCPGCGLTVCAPHKHTVLMGLTGTATATATCGNCGNNQVSVSDQF